MAIALVVVLLFDGVDPMQTCFCQQCRQSVPLGESFSVFGRMLCRECAQAEVARVGEAPEGTVSRNVDPTVCHHCGADGGERTLPLLATLPVCETCKAFLQNRPFPGWVKFFAAAVVAAVVAAWVWNGRFAMAYMEIKQWNQALVEGDYDHAATLISSASQRVPECRELGDYSAYCKALVLLRDDKCREALQTITPCASRFPPEWHVREIMSDARLGIAFDEGNYDEFLRLAEEHKAAQPTDPMRVAGVASAHACKYAETGDDAFRREALELLAQSHQLGDSPELADYDMRIRHRLHSREIIKRDEFLRRFPNGWNAPETTR